MKELNEIANAVGLQTGQLVRLTGESWKQKGLHGSTEEVAGIKVPNAEGYKEPFPYVEIDGKPQYIYHIGDVDYSVELVGEKGEESTHEALSGPMLPLPSLVQVVSHSSAAELMQKKADSDLIAAVLAWEAEEDSQLLSKALYRYHIANELIAELKESHNE